MFLAFKIFQAPQILGYMLRNGTHFPSCDKGSRWLVDGA